MEDATRDTRVMTPDEVAEALRVSRSHAYKLIRRLNAELEERGVSASLRLAASAS